MRANGMIVQCHPTKRMTHVVRNCSMSKRGQPTKPRVLSTFMLYKIYEPIVANMKQQRNKDLV
jgi:hypothetical protein